MSRLRLTLAMLRSPIKESLRRHAAGGFHPALRFSILALGIALIWLSWAL